MNNNSQLPPHIQQMIAQQQQMQQQPGQQIIQQPPYQQVIQQQPYQPQFQQWQQPKRGLFDMPDFAELGRKLTEWIMLLAIAMVLIYFLLWPMLIAFYEVVRYGR